MRWRLHHNLRITFVMPRSHIHRAPHDCSCPVLPGGLPWILETVGLPCEFNFCGVCGHIFYDVRAVCGCRAGAVRVPCGCRDYDMQCSCPCIYIYIQRDGIRSRREMAARESLTSQGRRREPGRQPPGVLHISRDP